jgi:two-component system cell cycle response regulator CtrA
MSWSRRSTPCAAFKGHAQSVITTGDLVVNLDAKTVEVGGQRVHLTGKEYQMLELLSLQGHHAHEEMFLNHLYGGMDEPELKIIDVFICKLRKLDAASGGRIALRRSGAAAMCCRAEDIRVSAARRKRPADRILQREPGFGRAFCLR